MNCPFMSGNEKGACMGKDCGLSITLWQGVEKDRKEVTMCSLAWLPTMLIELRGSMDGLVGLLAPKPEEKKKDK